MSRAYRDVDATNEADRPRPCGRHPEGHRRISLARAALREITRELAETPEGNRDILPHSAHLRVGTFVESGLLERTEPLAVLEATLYADGFGRAGIMIWFDKCVAAAALDPLVPGRRNAPHQNVVPVGPQCGTRNR